MNRQFFAGVAVGMAIAIILVMIGVGVAGYVLIKAMPDQEQVAAFLTEPDYPPAEAPATLGRIDIAGQLLTLDGESVAPDAFRDKVVFLNSWATWCQPCRAEMPGIEKLAGAMASEPVAVVLVSDEEPERVREYVSSRGLGLPVYVWASGVPDLFASRTIPATFVLDPAGNVVFKHIGAARWDGPASQEFLRRLAR
jgi:thiol-disulfide isomerase/thioredoxin